MAEGQLAYPKHLRNPKTDGQKRLAALFEEAVSTPTGRYIMTNVANDGVKIKFDISLNESNACGFYTVGQYSFSKKLMSLNPAGRVTDERRTATMVHEGRHHRQNELGASEHEGGNYPLHERVIMRWFKEADARMFSILFAWEQKQEGNAAYMDRLSKNNGYKPMITAFEEVLAEDSDNMRGAMRAAIRASYDMDKYERNYANAMISWIENKGITPNTSEPNATMLGDDIFWALGNAGRYGNYMSEELIAEIRSSFTAQDYADLVEERRKSGGAMGSACGDDKKDDEPVISRPKKPAVRAPA